MTFPINKDSIPEVVFTWLSDNGWGQVIHQKPVPGGCINQGSILQTASGKSFFLKTNSRAAQDMFEREAEGLAILNVGDGPRVPFPYCSGSNFLLLENLSPGPRQADYWLQFGRQLALLHNHSHPHFGFPHNNYIGSTPQPNPWAEDGYEFFAENRLIFQAQLARQRNLLERAQLSQVERLAARLPELVPPQPASLVHGDLWSGNAITDQFGNPAIIDPAAHFGWAEAELAMTDLFGSFPGEFYIGYQEVRRLETGFRERFPLYNLYHLLNHLNLFGRGYAGQVSFTLRLYG